MAWKFSISLTVILILRAFYPLDGLRDEIGQQEIEQQDTSLNGMWNSGKGLVTTCVKSISHRIFNISPRKFNQILKIMGDS